MTHPTQSPHATTERVVPLPIRPPLSDRETTAQDSIAQVDDPAYTPCLGDKLRFYRHGEILGWFDRIDGKPLPEGSIGSIRNSHEQAALRRQISSDIAIHTFIVTSMIAICVYPSAIARSLRNAFDGPWKLYLLASSLLAQLVVLKLVLDIPRLRTAVFSVYSISLAVTLAVFQFQWEAPYDVILCSCLATLATVVHFVLCDVQYRDSFLSTGTLWILVALVTGGGLGIVSTISNTFTPDGAVFGAITALLVVTYTLVYETLEFLHKLKPSEAPLGKYLIHIDVAAVVFFVMLYAVTFSLGLAMAIGTSLLELIVAVIKFACGGWRIWLARVKCVNKGECGLCMMWGLDCSFRRQRHTAQVAVDASHGEDQGVIAAVPDGQIVR